MELFLAVEAAIPPDHPASILAVPLGILFFVGSIYLLLWSNYGARKGGAIYLTAFFGFNFLIGVFWWFGGPGIPPSLGVTHLPGQSNNHYQARWYAFEGGSERDAFFDGTADVAAFQTIPEFLGLVGLDEDALFDDPLFAATAGSVDQGVSLMREQFLPIDENNVAQIGVERRSVFEDEARAAQPEGSRRAPTFYTAEAVGEPQLREDPGTGTLLATSRFQVFANFLDEDGVPFDPVPVGPEGQWFAFQDPGAAWLPSALWTIISLLGFIVSLAWLDRLEQRDKRRDAVEVEQPEDLAVPIAQ